MAQEMTDKLAMHRVAEFSKANIEKTSGEANPAKIPLGIKMGNLVRNIESFVPELQAIISANAITTLQNRASSEPYDLRDDKFFVDAIWNNDICASVGQLTATQLAAKVNEASAAFMERRDSRYRDLLRQLGDTDWKKLLDYVDLRITPNVRRSDIDPVLIATNLPTEYVHYVRIICEQRSAQRGFAPTERTLIEDRDDIELGDESRY